MCNFYIWGTLWDKVYSNNPCTEDGIENIQDVAFSMSLAELCATDNMLGIMHVFFIVVLAFSIPLCESYSILMRPSNTTK